LLTVSVEPARLSRDIGALELSSLEAVLCCLLLCFSRKVPRSQQLVNDSLVLADPIGEHATVVTVGIDTPLHIDYVASIVGDDGLRAPARSGLIVVNGHTSVVPAGTRATHGCGVEIGPCCYRLKDGALWARVGSRLKMLVKPVKLVSSKLAERRLTWAFRPVRLIGEER
jgi:hypothetical protein